MSFILDGDEGDLGVTFSGDSSQAGPSPENRLAIIFWYTEQNGVIQKSCGLRTDNASDPDLIYLPSNCQNNFVGLTPGSGGVPSC